MILRRSRFIHQLPVGNDRSLIVHAISHMRLPANAEINFEATGGTVTVAAAGGVTLNSPGGKVASSAQFVALTLKRTATDVWTLIGSLA